MAGTRAWWLWGAAVQVLRRSPAEALVWATTAGLLALRVAPLPQSGFPHMVLRAVPVAALAVQMACRGGLLWQLVPLVPVSCGLVGLLSTSLLWGHGGALEPATDAAGQQRWGWSGWSLYSAAWLLVGASLAALLAFPPSPFPPRSCPPTSPAGRRLYDVGFQHGEEDYDEEDDDEGDGAGQAKKAKQKKRAFYVWYPAVARAAASVAGSPRRDAGTSHYFPQYKSQMEAMFESMQYRLPTALLFSHLRYVHADTLADAPVLRPCEGPSSGSTAGGGWPTIVFSHGLYGFPSLYTHLCANLASLGYIVVAVGHTDGSGTIVSPLGGNVLSDFEPLPTSPSGQEIGGRELWAFRNKQLNVRIKDMQASLDTLERWNGDRDSPFYDALDLSRVAVAGHSFGGGTSLGLVLREAMAREGNDSAARRVKAAVLFDGWMYPLEGSDGPAFDRVVPAGAFEAAAPVLFIDAETWAGSETYFELNRGRIAQLCELSGGRWRRFGLRGTGHHNWNDFCFYAPIVSRLVGLTRERDLAQAHEDTISLVDAFLADALEREDFSPSSMPRLARAVDALDPDALLTDR